MGQIIQIQCTKCDYQKELFVGGGLLDCELKTIAAALPEDGQRILAGAIRFGATQFSITRKPCSCDYCKTIYALPVVSYTLHNMTQELYGVCPECGKPGSNSQTEKTILHCPDCGAETTLRQTGHWD